MSRWSLFPVAIFSESTYVNYHPMLSHQKEKDWRENTALCVIRNNMGFCPYLEKNQCIINGNERNFLQRMFTCSKHCQLYQYEIQRRRKNGTLRHNDSHSDYHDDDGSYNCVYDPDHDTHSDSHVNDHTDYLY